MPCSFTSCALNKVSEGVHDVSAPSMAKEQPSLQPLCQNMVKNPMKARRHQLAREWDLDLGPGLRLDDLVISVVLQDGMEM